MHTKRPWRHTALLICLAIALPGWTIAQDGTACKEIYVTGPRAYASKMGEYNLVEDHTEHGRPVYKHHCQQLYMYYYESGESTFWLVGPEVGKIRGYLLAHSDAMRPYEVTAGTWRAWRTDIQWKPWQAAPSINVRCRLPTCSKFSLDGVNLPNTLRGTYELQENTHSLRPVYKHTTYNYYVFYDSGCANWRVGENPDGNTVVLWVCANEPTPEYTPRHWSRLLASGSNETVEVDLTCLVRVGDTNVSPLDCGMSLMMKSVGAKLLGGKDALPDQYPWMISLVRSDKKHKCGGSLISHRWVITAGHCIHNTALDDMTIAIGVYDYSKENIVGKEHKIKNAFRPDEFVFIDFPFKILYDLALIELENDVPYSQHVQPICLPPTDKEILPTRDAGDTVDSAYHDCMATGWGMQEHLGSTGGPLQEIGVTRLKTIDYCMHTNYWDLREWVDQTPSSCVYFDNSGLICKGDSGSPLMCLRDGRWVVMGVGSWSPITCMTAHHPSVFAHTSELMPWIKSIIE